MVGSGYTKLDSGQNNAIANSHGIRGMHMTKHKSTGQDKPETTVKFYGKKTYCLSPLIARKVTAKENAPRYQDNENEDYRSYIKRG